MWCIISLLWFSFFDWAELSQRNKIGKCCWTQNLYSHLLQGLWAFSSFHLISAHNSHFYAKYSRVISYSQLPEIFLAQVIPVLSSSLDSHIWRISSEISYFCGRTHPVQSGSDSWGTCQKGNHIFLLKILYIFTMIIALIIIMFIFLNFKCISTNVLFWNKSLGFIFFESICT